MSTKDRQDSSRMSNPRSRKVISISSARAQRRHAPATTVTGPQPPSGGNLTITPMLPNTTSAVPGAVSTPGSTMLEELLATGFIGLWKDRDEMHDSTAYVQQLRERIQARADITEPAK